MPVINGGNAGHEPGTPSRAVYDDDDLRALSTELGTQAAVVPLPATPAIAWCSADETAAVNSDERGVHIHTVGAIDPDTAIRMAGAIIGHAAACRNRYSG